MHDLIHDLVTEVARDSEFVSANLPPDLAHRISIRNAFLIQYNKLHLHSNATATPAAVVQQRHAGTFSMVSSAHHHQVTMQKSLSLTPSSWIRFRSHRLSWVCCKCST
jgi:hypothetical protein